MLRITCGTDTVHPHSRLVAWVLGEVLTVWLYHHSHHCWLGLPLHFLWSAAAHLKCLP